MPPEPLATTSPLNRQTLKLSHCTPTSPPSIVNWRNTKSVESTTRMVCAVLPETSTMDAPCVPTKVRRLKPLITTFSLHVPKMLSLLGTEGSSSFKAAVMLVGPVLLMLPQCTLRVLWCRLQAQSTRPHSSIRLAID